MRGSPATAVHLVVPPLRDHWVCFEPLVDGPHLSAEQRRECDEYWESLELTGAIIICQLDWIVAPVVEAALCRDWRLTANVIYRNRDGLLHADFPLIDTDLVAPNKVWATDDPRLTRLVPASERR